jgi:hypothetical protein
MLKRSHINKRNNNSICINQARITTTKQVHMETNRTRDEEEKEKKASITTFAHNTSNV